MYSNLGSLIVSHLDQSCFLGRSSAGSPAGSGRTTPATWSTPRRGACSVPRDHPTPAPDSPARRRAAEVKMVGYITVAHGAAQRLSEKWRHFVCALLSSLFCTSPRCVGVHGGGSGGSGGLRRGRDTGEVTFDGALGAVADAKEGELGPPAELACDDVSRTPLYDNPAGHEVSGLVTVLPQPLLHTTPVGLEFGHLGGGVLRVPPITSPQHQFDFLAERRSATQKKTKKSPLWPAGSPTGAVFCAPGSLARRRLA